MGKKHTVINISNQTVEFAVQGGRHIRLAPREKSSLTDRECNCYAIKRAASDFMVTVVDPKKATKNKKLASIARKARDCVNEKANKKKEKEQSQMKSRDNSKIAASASKGSKAKQSPGKKDTEAENPSPATERAGDVNQPPVDEQASDATTKPNPESPDNIGSAGRKPAKER